MNGGVVDQNSITLSSTHAGHSDDALVPAGYLITPARRRHLLQSERTGVRSGKRILGLASYKTVGRWKRVAHHFLVDRSLDPPATQLVLDILTMALEIAALRDDIDSLTLVVSDRARLPRLAGHGYLHVLENSHEVWVQKTVRCDSGDSAA